MSIDEVQAMAAAQLAANTDLAAFGTPITYSENLDEEAVKGQIASALHSPGVVLEIGEPDFENGEGTPSRAQKLDANFLIYAAENPKVAHSPSGLALVKTIVQALTRKFSNYEQAPICTGVVKGKSEQGYVMYEIAFTAPVLVR